jgi:hypothetical protein
MLENSVCYFSAEDVLVVLGENFEKRVDTERVFDTSGNFCEKSVKVGCAAYVYSAKKRANS